MVNVSLLRVRTDRDTWHSNTIPILISNWMHDIIIESALIIPAYENHRTTPLGTFHHGVHETRHVGLSSADKSRRMFAVSPIWNDPRKLASYHP